MHYDYVLVKLYNDIIILVAIMNYGENVMCYEFTNYALVLWIMNKADRVGQVSGGPNCGEKHLNIWIGAYLNSDFWLFRLVLVAVLGLVMLGYVR